MVHYYGFYSNVSRGKRKKQDQDGMIPSILEPDGSSKEYRRNWARLIQKIYEVDPLTCSKCGGGMKILSFIEDPEIVKKILKHIGLWPVGSLQVEREVKARPPPKANAPPPNVHIDYLDYQVPPCDEYLYSDLDISQAEKERGLVRKRYDRLAPLV